MRTVQEVKDVVVGASDKAPGKDTPAREKSLEAIPDETSPPNKKIRDTTRPLSYCYASIVAGFPIPRDEVPSLRKDACRAPQNTTSCKLGRHVLPDSLPPIAEILETVSKVSAPVARELAAALDKRKDS